MLGTMQAAKRLQIAEKPAQDDGDDDLLMTSQSQLMDITTSQSQMDEVEMSGPSVQERLDKFWKETVLV